MHDPETSLDPADGNRGRKRRLQDPLPLEEAPRRDGRNSFNFNQQNQQQQTSNMVNESDSTVPAAPINPTYVPRSGYYFQHDDRTGPIPGRSNKRRDYERDGRKGPPTRPRYDDSRSRHDDRARDDYNGRKSDRHIEPSQASLRPKTSDDAWTHDKFLENQADDMERKRQPVERSKTSGKREFRETPPLRAENKDDAKDADGEKRSERRYAETVDKRSERGHLDMQRERDRYRERGPDFDRGRWMDSDPSRNRFNARRSFNRYNGDGDRIGGRYDPSRRNPGGPVVAADRWNHDKFEELNRSPMLKQEEDSIAQIEALLAT
ncbi:hypothetical protein KP509_08G042100 [Ceratopteris richardii]|nr:hypothetical protein KP509_08G042100 [Ceratopteris richardii]